MGTSEVVAIDLGSNSYRVLKYDCKKNKTIGEFEATVGLADGLSQTQKISDEAIDRVIKAIKQSIEKLQFEPQKTVAVTTHAMRKALNSKEVIKKLYEETGILFKIIDGDTEAKLTLLAMKYALQREKIEAKKFFLLDIGGGSTELIYCHKEQEIMKSFSYGIVTLSQSIDKSQELKQFQNEVKLFLNSLEIDDAIFISTAGTPTTLAALKNGLNFKTYDKTIVNGTLLDQEEVKKRQQYLKNLSKDKLIEEVGSGRDDYIDAGISIYLLFFETLGIKESIVFDDGLREGVAINYCQNDC